jgi:predicted DNA-binding antitoxin AbrB/MazE fold protein
MSLTVEATYENGVFVPLQRPALPDHERVRLTVEPIASPTSAAEIVRHRRENRIQLDLQLAQEIALSKELHPDAS